MAPREMVIFGALSCCIALSSERADASDCTPRTRLSPCFDADTLWTPAAPSPFVTIPSSKALPRGSYALGLALSYASEPVTLRTLAPDPSGRTVLVVDDVVDASVAAAYSPARHLELGIVVPTALYRTGTGLSGVTSQSGPALTAAALRDVRIGAGHDLVLHPHSDDDFRFTAMARLDLALPTGDEDAFAGESGPVLAPSVTLGLGNRRVFFGAEEGARVRKAVDFGGSRLGTQLISSLGANAELTPDGSLSLSLEAWILPNFLSTRRTLPDGVVVTGGALVPAEWMATAWTRLSQWTLSLGGGSAIPLSSETRRALDGTETTDHFAGVTTPRFRLVLTVRYSSE